MLIQLQMQTQQLLQHSIMQQQQLQHRLQEQMTIQQQQQTAQLQILQHLVSGLDTLRQTTETLAASRAAPVSARGAPTIINSPLSARDSLGGQPESSEAKLRQFLEKAGLAKYRTNFSQQEVTFEQLHLLVDRDLQQLGISNLRDRVLFFKARTEILGPPPPPHGAMPDGPWMGYGNFMPQNHPWYGYYGPHYPPYPPAPHESQDLARVVVQGLESLKSATGALRTAVDGLVARKELSQPQSEHSSSSSSSQ